MVPRTRRDILYAGITGLGGLLAGCEAPLSNDAVSPPSQNTEEHTPTAQGRDPEKYVADWHPKPIRGEGRPLLVTDEGAEAVDGEDAVRTRYSGSNQIQAWRTATEWDDHECTADTYCIDVVACVSAAADAIEAHITERFGSPGSIVVLQSVVGDQREDRVSVGRKLAFNRDGEVVSRPSIRFRTLREATPETVFHVSESADGRLVCEVPVLVQDISMQMV